MERLSFSQTELDALKEVGNISAGNAATAFSQIVGKKINMNVPQVSVFSIQELEQSFKDEEIKIGLYQKILGQASGSILIVFPKQSAADLIEMVFPNKKGSGKILEIQDEDLLRELANITSGAYFTTLAKMTNFFFMPSVPHLTIDFTHLMIQHLLKENPGLTRALFILNELNIEGTKISFQVILLPDLNALPLILAAIGVH
ncbi:MAG: chemotaxis protein CheC [Candidatus Eremiobacteraeota bacterium]|nr:chemotaxis protein CheC [Candidatus Eremiobacteraeota bacterium]MCL5055635.1 chemotaxis protein CheC [Bacillota bacterium]